MARRSRSPVSRGPIAALPLVVAMAVIVAACAKSNSDVGLLQPGDLAVPEGMTFDPNNVVSLAALADDTNFTASALQKFLASTSYGRSSFLETYQSNGVRAVDAMISASLRYRISPLVLLVRAQIDQGLVGAQDYPSAPARVEYAFGCGCATTGVCNPLMAGFDLQVACLAQALRQNLDDISTNGTTTGGFGPGVTSKTLDGVSVTPADAGTAALYQYDPRVARGAGGGSYVFWTVFNNYANTIGYVAPASASTATSWVGDSCQSSSDCIASSSICQTAANGTYCTMDCTNEACPSLANEAATQCTMVAGLPRCLAVCSPSTASSCRSDFTCTSKASAGTETGSTANVCFPPT